MENKLATNALQKSAQSIQQTLDARGLGLQVIQLTETARTANDAAAALKCDVAQIVKSLIFKTANSNKPVLVLVSGPNRVNEKAVETQIGEPIVKADANFTEEVTGFAIGGIPPLGHKKQIEHILIDEDLLKYPDLWAAAGTPHAVFNLRAADLQPLTNGKVISIK